LYSVAHQLRSHPNHHDVHLFFHSKRGKTDCFYRSINEIGKGGENKSHLI
jgi:hypothetical protein